MSTSAFEHCFISHQNPGGATVSVGGSFDNGILLCPKDLPETDLTS